MLELEWSRHALLLKKEQGLFHLPDDLGHSGHGPDYDQDTGVPVTAWFKCWMVALGKAKQRNNVITAQLLPHSSHEGSHFLGLLLVHFPLPGFLALGVHFPSLGHRGT